MPCFHSGPHLLLGEYSAEGSSGTEPECLALISLLLQPSSALQLKPSSCPEREGGSCATPVGIESSEYRLTYKAFLVQRQHMLRWWVLVPSALGRSGRLVKSAAAGLCV